MHYELEEGKERAGRKRKRGGERGRKRRTYRADVVAVKIYCTITPNYICPLNYRMV